MDIFDALARAVGDAQVLTGDATRPYARDWTGKYEGQPLAVVRPATTDEVAAVVRAAARVGVALVPMAGNTGLMGGTHAPGNIIVSLERMTAIRAIKPEARLAVVEAGVVLEHLHAAAETHDLVFPLTFGAKGSARIGGVLGTNAGGSNVVRHGTTRALCLGLEVVLADGRILDTMSELVKDNSGYDLRDLFIGAEGTLGIVTAAVLRLAPRPAAYATAMVAVPSVGAALTLLNRLQAETGGAVEAFEYMPGAYFDALLAHDPGHRAPFGSRYAHAVMVEIAATSRAEAAPGADGAVPVQSRLETTLAALAAEGLVLDATLARSEAQRRAIWHAREVAGELCVVGGPSMLTDISVPLDRVETFLDRAHAALEADDPYVRHLVVSHLGDGNVHLAVWPSDGVAGHDRVSRIVEDVTQDLGGSFSAEHGVGLGKRGAMGRRKDVVALDVMRAIKRALDPHDLMNPGKVLP